MRRGRAALMAGLVASALAAALPAGASGAEPGATIRWTAHGIPHIKARDYTGLGYGYGYAFASQNICTMADSYVTVRGERSRHFGPEAGYQFRGNGSTANNLKSDFFYKRIIDARTVEKLISQAPPAGPRAEVRALVRGYVKGYNLWLARTGVNKIRDPECRGKPWVKPIAEIDAYRRFYQLALLASGGVAIDGIGGAQPPTPPLDGAGQPGLPTPAELGELGDKLPLGGIGSNAYGLGKDATATGKGMLLGNPHFPWDGAERFFEAQLTIPGKVDVQGASLFGVPLVLIGHTPTMAWSHTVSTAFRFTPFEEKLVPGSPTTYLVDGQPRQMKAEKVTVQARRPDGTLEPRTRTLYSTEHGAIFTELLGQPLFPWTPTQAYAMGDANAANFRYLNHFFETNHARSTDELHAVLKRNQGIPWVNTIAADSRGKAFYADISVTPNVTDAKAGRCNTALGAATFQALRLPVLDGSRAECNWDRDADAAQEGIFGPRNMPHLFRSDYVTNGNDSYWLTHPDQPLTGFARIIGDEGTARSLRTRLGLRMVQQRLDGSDRASGKRFTLEQLMDVMFNNRQYAGELWRDELVAMCRQTPVVPTSRGPVDVSPACPVLAAWDLRDDIGSRGALLFRRFATRALAIQGGPYRQSFDPRDPVNTPRGLNTENPAVRAALGEAVADLREANIPLDAPLGDFQYEMRGGERIPIHGGPGTVGVFNAINVPFVADKGYPNVPHGSSFVMVTEFGKGCPRTRAILAYSQSTSAESEFFADQTRMYSRKQWVKLPYCERAIARATVRTTRLGAAQRPRARRGQAQGRRGARTPRFTG